MYEEKGIYVRFEIMSDKNLTDDEKIMLSFIENHLIKGKFFMTNQLLDWAGQYIKVKRPYKRMAVVGVITDLKRKGYIENHWSRKCEWYFTLNKHHKPNKDEQESYKEQ